MHDKSFINLFTSVRHWTYTYSADNQETRDSVKKAIFGVNRLAIFNVEMEDIINGNASMKTLSITFKQIVVR